MARVFKRKRTVAIPAGAEIVKKGEKRFAKYRTSSGKLRTDPIIKNKIVVDALTYTLSFTDADGREVRVPTRCTDKDAAQAILTERLKQIELFKAGVITAKDLERVASNSKPIMEHISNYVEWLIRTDNTKKHADGVRYYLTDLTKRNGWRKFPDMTRDDLERSMRAVQDEGLSARTANEFRKCAVAFANWAISQRLIVSNPFTGIQNANEAADPRRQRRAFSHDELIALLDATERRPLDDALNGNRGNGAAKLTQRTIERLKRTGRERRLFYWLLATTGLRVNEARSLRLVDVDLESKPARVHLRASTTKNGQNDTLPLREELAAELKAWIAGRRVVSFKSDSEMLFTGIAEKMTKVFDRDLKFAGIPKRDGRGRTVDVHALRHTFATSLARAKVPVQIAQKLLRHATPAMTLNIYTHCELADFNSAVESLPSILPEKQKETVLVNLQPQTSLTANLTVLPGINRQNKAFVGIHLVEQADSTTAKEKPVFVELIQQIRGDEDGGRSRTRTCDPLRVRQVL